MKIYKIETTIALGDNETDQLINTLDTGFQIKILDLSIGGKFINCNSTCILEKSVDIPEENHEDWFHKSCEVLGVNVTSEDWVEDDGTDLSYDVYSTCIDPYEHKLEVDLKLHMWQPGFTEFDKTPQLIFLKDDIDNNFSISLDEKEENIKYLSGNYKVFLTDKALETLIKNIKKYRIAFLNMWRDKLMSSLELKKAINRINKGINIRLLNYKTLEKRYGKY